MREDLLEPLRDDPLPPSSVDIGRALADGRRQIRVRQLGTVVTSACAVLAIAAGGAFAVDLSRVPVDRTGVGSAATGGARATSPLPAAAPAAFDPLRQYASFGWLPDGLTDRFINTRTDQLNITVSTPPGAGGKDEGRAVDLRIVPAGHDIALGMAGDFATEPGVTAGWSEISAAEPVNGRPARWNGMAISGGPGAALRWEYAPGAWAEVIVRNPPAGEDPRTIARRIAESVRYGVNEPIRLPFRLGGLPAGLTPMEVAVGRSADGWNARVDYGAGKRTGSGDWPLMVMVTPRSATTGDGGGVVGDPDSTIDGHPARRTPYADGRQGLQVYGVQGLYLELATHDATTRQLPGGLDGLFRTMTLYPEPGSWQ